LKTVAHKLKKGKIQFDKTGAYKEYRKHIFLSFSERAGFAKYTEV
jgi:hypothetical protein